MEAKSVAGIYVVYFGICKILFSITDLTAIQLGHWYFSLDRLKKVQTYSLPGTDHILAHLIEARCKKYILFAVRRHENSSARSLQLQPTVKNTIWVSVVVIQEWRSNQSGWTNWDSNSGGGRDFPHPSRPAPMPIQPPVQRVPGLIHGC